MTIRETYAGKLITAMEEWGPLEAALLEDAKKQMEEAGLVFFKYLPNMFKFGFVAATADNTKWIHVTSPDMREDANWMDAISIRRMSSERDWKGDALHSCAWESLGEACTEYFKDEYDDEVL